MCLKIYMKIHIDEKVYKNTSNVIQKLKTFI